VGRHEAAAPGGVVQLRIGPKIVNVLPMYIVVCLRNGAPSALPCRHYGWNLQASLGKFIP
jgi:hypothetical protein